MNFNLFKKTAPVLKKSEDKSEIPVCPDIFEKDVMAMKLNLVNTFVKAKEQELVITDDMRNIAIQSLLCKIPEQVDAAVKEGKEYIYIFPSHIKCNPIQGLTRRRWVQERIFHDVIKDVCAILKSKNINAEASSNSSINGWMKIMVDELKKFSNVEKLGALQ
jgi:hypothetical protein